MSKRLRRALWAGAFAMLLLACAPWLDEFLDAAAEQKATQDEVRQRLGKPSTVSAGREGGEEWTYRMFHASYAGSAGKNSCFEYRLHFDKQKTLQKWEREPCKP